MAVRKGLKLNEYGLFDAKTRRAASSPRPRRRSTTGSGCRGSRRRCARTAARSRRRSRASCRRWCRDRTSEGDLHTHTNLTDGLATLEEMVETARGRAATRTTRSPTTRPNLYMQRMTDEKMLAQRERVRDAAATHPKMTLLHGTELNIDPDGDVDWDEDFLAGFDLTRGLGPLALQPVPRRDDRAGCSARCENPYVNIIGHPTTRLIGKRPPIDFDLEAVFEAAARTGTALEINSLPGPARPAATSTSCGRGGTA